jgi:hypothetical protein
MTKKYRVLIESEDDCAHDAREYFNRHLKAKGIPIVDTFHKSGKKVDFDGGFFTEYSIPPYVLTIQADDPFYRLYREEETITNG